jgi:hypothetical protein
VGERLERWLFIGGLVALVGGVLGLPAETLAGLFADDAYFYLKAARNVATGLGVTFDGLQPTNGYHYGWLALLAGAFELGASATDAGLLRVALLVHVGLYGVLGGSMFIGAQRLPPFVTLVALWLWLPLVAIPTVGMESSLLAASVALYCRCLGSPSDSLPWRVGAFACGALAVASRQDAILLLATLVFFVPGGVRIRGLWGLAGGAGALAAMAAGNLLYFGHASTISSHLKFFPSVVPLQQSWLGEFGLTRILRFLGPIPVGLALAFYLWHRALGDRKAVAQTLLGLNVHSLVYVLLLVAFGTGAHFAWYYAISTGVVLLALAEASTELRRGPRVAALVAGVGLFAVLSWRLASRAALDATPYMAHVANLQSYVSPDEPVFLVDQSGRLGFWSKRAVVNGDGLVNTWEFQRAIADDTLENYFDTTGIRWVITDPKSSYVVGDRVYLRVPGWRGSFFRGGRQFAQAPVGSAVTTLFDASYMLIPRASLTFTPGSSALRSAAARSMTQAD